MGIVLRVESLLMVPIKTNAHMSVRECGYKSQRAGGSLEVRLHVNIYLNVKFWSTLYTPLFF